MHNKLYEHIIKTALKTLSGYNAEFLFATLGGSRLRGLESEISDYDFYIFFKHPNPTSFSTQPFIRNKTKFVYNETIYECDLQFHSIDYYLNYSKNWKPPIIPTKFTEQIKYRPNLFTSLTSDVIITDNDFLKINASTITKAFKRDMLLDFFLSHNIFIFNKYLLTPNVRLRTYLYVILDILCFNWIYEYTVMPEMDFLKLFNFYSELFNNDERTEIKYMFKSNKKSLVPYHSNYIQKNLLIENFIKKQLNEQIKKLKIFNNKINYITYRYNEKTSCHFNPYLQ